MRSPAAVRSFLWVVLLAPALSFAAVPYTNLYVLGDSLSDTGNVKRVYDAIVAGNGGNSPLPGQLGTQIPPPPYYLDGAGGATFSNGLNYSQVLAAKLGLSATASLLGGTNYAFGGARTDYQIYQFASPSFLGLTAQRDRLLADHPAGLDPNALYVVFGGGNNVQDMLTGVRSPGNTGLGPPSTVQETVADISSVVSSLYGAGAQHLILANVPNVSLVPRIVELNNPAATTGAFQASVGINLGIDAIIAAHAAAGRDIRKLDVFDLLNDTLANAAALGFTNTTGRAYDGDDLGFVTIGDVVDNPDEYFFWDGIHPTWRVHEILGNAAYVVAVPEPQTWLLLAVGLVLLTTLARRRAASVRDHRHHRP